VKIPVSTYGDLWRFAVKGTSLQAMDKTKLEKHGRVHPMSVPGTVRRERPADKTEWTFTPWIRVRPGTDVLELLGRARENDRPSSQPSKQTSKLPARP
jgi:hypothetical protein